MMTPLYLNNRIALPNCTGTAFRMENDCLHVFNVVLLSVRFSTTQKPGEYWPKLGNVHWDQRKKVCEKVMGQWSETIWLLNLIWCSGTPVWETWSKTGVGQTLWVLRGLSYTGHMLQPSNMIGNSSLGWPHIKNSHCWGCDTRFTLARKMSASPKLKFHLSWAATGSDPRNTWRWGWGTQVHWRKIYVYPEYEFNPLQTMEGRSLPKWNQEHSRTAKMFAPNRFLSIYIYCYFLISAT